VPEGHERDEAGTHAPQSKHLGIVFARRGPRRRHAFLPIESKLPRVWVPASSRLLASLTSGAGMTQGSGGAHLLAAKTGECMSWGGARDHKFTAPPATAISKQEGQDSFCSMQL